ncbi:MAG TPA: biotin--[acetyl-CoA-carboxylase] ligase [Acidobacteriota bacterium]|nr:biotin--[acetyl-CoA-carboxylase] ligase [Acidobacteriota bacterium]
MNESIAIPEILNKVASAGHEGLPLPENPALTGELELCRSWGYALRFECGRAFLLPDPDSVVPALIEQETPLLAWDKICVRGFLEVGSTNEIALELARAGAAGGTVVCAERQTAGRGRKGRSWSSNPGAGIYCTIVVRPRQEPDHWPLLAHAASVAVAEALREVVGECAVANPPVPDLKWPNDVFLSGKKTAGILIETAVTRGTSPCAVVGIGINVREGSVPAELRDIATCVDRESGSKAPRRRILCSCLHRFQLCYGLFEDGEHGELLERWKGLSSMWNGVPIWVEDGGPRRAVVTCGLTELGALRVRDENGKEDTLLAADVTIRRA